MAEPEAPPAKPEETPVPAGAPPTGAEPQELNEQLRAIEAEMNKAVAGAAPAPGAAAPAVEAAASKKAGKKGKKAKKAAVTEPEIPWTVILGRKLATARNFIWEMGASLRSPDRPTRRMASAFFLSCAGLVGVLTFGWVELQRSGFDLGFKGGEEMDQAKGLEKFFSRQRDAALLRVVTLKIGKFKIELLPAPGQEKMLGVVNMAEVEIVLECDQKETCKYMEDNLPKVRDQIASILTAVERNEILSPEGKKRLKRGILRKVNLWLPIGKVRNLFFTNLVVG